MTSSDDNPGHGLWRMMHKSAPAEEEVRDEPTADEPSDDLDAPVGESEGEPSDAAPPQGLWAIMSGRSPAASGTDAGENASREDPPVESTAPPIAAGGDESAPSDDQHVGKGLWGVMRSTPSAPVTGETASQPVPRANPFGPPVDVEAPAPATKPARGPWVPPLPPDDPEPADAAADDIAEPAAVALATLPSPAAAPEASPAAVDDIPFAAPQPKPAASRSRGALLALLLGLAAVPLAALAMLPEFMLKLPAAVAGFGALVLGYLAVGEIRRSRGRQTGRSTAIAGMLLGVAGMVLAPTAFTELGAFLRSKYGRQRTYNNLEHVGAAVNVYYKKQGHFPPEGTYKPNADGRETPMHSWMTQLLPYMGNNEVDIYNKIDFSRPYSDAENRYPFSRTVPAFHASGSDTDTTPGGYGTTHFAAVGGVVRLQAGGVADAGAFGRNSKLSFDDFKDGKSYTMIAGEIAWEFPRWGAPGNVRAIGKGLNKDREGFGNADRTGAMFLMADGSVRFFSNKTDPEILRRFATRNGEEQIPDEFRR